MSEKKNYWYVLVFTNNGPKYVTSVNYADKTAGWDELEKPYEFNKSTAQDLALGLTLNMHFANSVCVPYKIENQPYRYDFGGFEWVDKKSEKTT